MLSYPRSLVYLSDRNLTSTLLSKHHCLPFRVYVLSYTILFFIIELNDDKRVIIKVSKTVTKKIILKFSLVVSIIPDDLYPAWSFTQDLDQDGQTVDLLWSVQRVEFKITFNHVSQEFVSFVQFSPPFLGHCIGKGRGNFGYELLKLLLVINFTILVFSPCLPVSVITYCLETYTCVVKFLFTPLQLLGL